MICGIKEETIRKAFYEGKVNDLLNKIQANERLDPEDIEKLEEHLVELAEEQKSTSDILSRFIPSKDRELPSVIELMGASPEQKEKIKKLEAEAQQDIKTVLELIKQITKQRKEQTHIESQKWYDWGMTLATYQLSIDSYIVWKSQLYYAKIIELMDDTNCSRREAEDRAGLTEEYKNHEVAKLFAKRITTIISLCKSNNQF